MHHGKWEEVCLKGGDISSEDFLHLHKKRICTPTRRDELENIKRE